MPGQEVMRRRAGEEGRLASSGLMRASERRQAAEAPTVEPAPASPVTRLIRHPASRPRQARAHLLVEDPDLGRWLTPAEVAQARRRLVVPVLALPCGPWAPPAPHRAGREHLGLLVIDGLIAREETLAGSGCTELIGAGELFQPWTVDPDEPLVPRTVSWVALQRTSLGVLGPSFVSAVQPWPPIRSALFDRAMRRCSRISTHHALSQLNPVDARLLVLFWHLAERWGRVTRGGVLMPLQLSQEALGHLVGAKRPTVCLALRRLQAEGLIERRPDRSWVLHGTAQEGLERLGGAGAGAGTLHCNGSA